MKESGQRQDAAEARRVLVVRIDTTGTSLDRDEILRVCILDASGSDASPSPVFNSVFKPARHASWPAAERKNGISPFMTANAPSFAEKLDKLNAVLAKADGLVFYNADFDIPFLRSQGAVFPRNAAVFDVMRDWSYHRAGVQRESQDVRWVSASDMAKGLGLREPGRGLEERTGFLRCAFRRLALAGIVKPRPFAGETLQEWNEAVMAAAIAGNAPAGQAAAPRPGAPAAGARAPESAASEAPRPAPAEKAVPRFSNEEIRALRRRLDGTAPEDLDALLGRPSPGFFTDADGSSHRLATPILRLMGCEKMSYEEAVAWLMEHEDAVLKARDARLQAQAASVQPAEPEGDEVFCFRCQDAFVSAAASGYVLPGKAQLNFSMRILEDGRVECRLGISDPDGMLYAEGQAPGCAVIYRARREGARIDPAVAARQFAKKLAAPGVLPPGLGAFCSVAVNDAVEAASKPAQEAVQKARCSSPAV